MSWYCFVSMFGHPRLGTDVAGVTCFAAQERRMLDNGSTSGSDNPAAHATPDQLMMTCARQV
jgi:hypothetical protein